MNLIKEKGKKKKRKENKMTGNGSNGKGDPAKRFTGKLRPAPKDCTSQLLVCSNCLEVWNTTKNLDGKCCNCGCEKKVYFKYDSNTNELFERRSQGGIPA